MTAIFIVRAQVPAADRDAFDRWYEAEHLPEAKANFGATAARRGWSDTDPGEHVAIYEFASLDTARKIAANDGSAVIQALIAEFGRVWGGRIPRTREIIGIAQTI
ncbi:MAG: hypothetical protein AAF666_21535 [Pseudomonadota bacterium]